MRPFRAALLGLLLLGACATPRLEPSWQSLALSFGPHGLDEPSWRPIDARVVGALTWSGRLPGWPCGAEFGVQYARAESKDESVARDADFLDFRLGAAAEWRPAGWLVLDGGAGPRLALAQATRPGTLNEVTESEGSFGVYAHAGAFVVVHGAFSIGLEGQWADGSDYEILGASRDAATAEILLALRWSF